VLHKTVRSPLTSNATFTHLMIKMGAHPRDEPTRTKFKNKSAADAFETIIAAVHKEQVMDALRSWLRGAYWPLLRAANEGYAKWCAQR
jgi:dsRNA-specific ribonuclease